MPRAEPSGISLTESEASIAKGMIARGDRQHDIAAWFGVNGGRIGDISTGNKFPNVTAATVDKLPPPGPYLTGRDAHPDIIAMADLVTEMTLVKHPFRAGVKAQPGIEF